MKKRAIGLWAVLLILSFLLLILDGCKKKGLEIEAQSSSINDTVSVDALTEEDIQAIDAMRIDTIAKFVDLRFSDGSSVRNFLTLHDSAFLNQYPSGKTSFNNDLDYKNAMLITRMLAFGYHLEDRSQHVYNEALPNHTGVAYSFGSKQYFIRKKPRAGNCNTQVAYHGLDCSGFIFQLADKADMHFDTSQFECGTSYLKNAQNYNNALTGIEFNGLKAVNIGARKLADLAIGDIIVWNYGHCGICDGKIGNDIGMLNCSSYSSEKCEKNFLPERGVVRKVLTEGYLNNYKGGSQVIRFTGNCFELAADTNVSNNGVEVWASGGTPPFKFSLDGGAFEEVGNFVFNSPYNPHKTYLNLLPGPHFVKVKDMLECEDSLAVIISQCNGTLNLAVNRTGKILTASATGGAPPYQFKFYNEPYSSSNIYNMEYEGRYSVVVKDINNCTDTLVDCFSDVVINSITCTPMNLIDIHPNGNFSISYSTATGLIPSFLIFNNNEYILSNWLITGGNSSFYIPNLNYCSSSGFQVPYTHSQGSGTVYNRTLFFILNNQDKVLGASQISFRLGNYCNGTSACPLGPYHQDDLWSSVYSISW